MGLFILLLVALIGVTVEAQTAQDAALCGLIAGTNIGSIPNYEEWTCSTSGITTTDPCLNVWSGVLCDEGVVTSLDLINQGIIGSLPSSLGSFDAITTLILYGNFFSGSIPSSLGDMTNLLWLYLNSNDLSGEIPASLCNLTDMVYMNFESNNNFSCVPECLFNSTVDVYIDSYVALCGEEVPATQDEALCDFYFSTSISQNYPEWNCTSDGVPVTPPCGWNGVTCNYGFAKELDFYSLFSVLTGTMPNTIGNLTSLTSFGTMHSYLSGTLPSSIGQIEGLTYLDFSYSSFTGTLPASYGKLVNLHFLEFGEISHLQGPIPSAFGNLRSIESMELGGCALTGTLPSELGLMNSTVKLSLSRNKFHGSIPSTFGQLSSLTILELQNNLFTGLVPSSFGQISMLTYLNLENTFLTGALPPSLCNIPDLDTVACSNTDIYCYPACLNETKFVQNYYTNVAPMYVCGYCNAGEYYIESTRECVLCSPSTYNPTPTTPTNNITECTTCPQCYSTNGMHGQTSCNFFLLENHLWIVYWVLGTTTALYLICWLFAGEVSVVIFVNMMLPMADQLTDILYVMNENFYNELFFAFAAFFLVAPCAVFVYELMREGNIPVFTYLPYTVLWLGVSKGNVPTVSGQPILVKASDDNATQSIHILQLVVLWPSMLLLQAVTLCITLVWILLYFIFMLFWITVGSILYHSRTLAVGKIRRMWYTVLLQDDVFGDDIATIDVEVLNRTLFAGFVFETLPQMCVQLANALNVGWGTIAKASFAVSFTMAVFGIHKFVYWKFYRGLHMKEIPVNPLVPTVSWLKLPVEATPVPNLRSSSMDGECDSNSSLLSKSLSIKSSLVGITYHNEFGDIVEDSVSSTGSTNGEETATADSVKPVSEYLPPQNMIDTIFWLGQSRGFPVCFGLSVFTDFDVHDNPLTLGWWMFSWFICISLQAFTVVLAPVWVPVMLFGGVSMGAEHYTYQASGKQWLKTIMLSVNTLLFWYIILSPNCIFSLTKPQWTKKMECSHHRYLYFLFVCGSFCLINMLLTCRSMLVGNDIISLTVSAVLSITGSIRFFFIQFSKQRTFAVIVFTDRGHPPIVQSWMVVLFFAVCTLHTFELLWNYDHIINFAADMKYRITGERNRMSNSDCKRASNHSDAIGLLPEDG